MQELNVMALIMIRQLIYVDSGNVHHLSLNLGVDTIVIKRFQVKIAFVCVFHVFFSI